MKRIFILLGAFYFLGAAFAEEKKKVKVKVTEGRIIQVNRKLTSFTKKTRPPKDFFVNLGSLDQIKVGDVFYVYRDLPVVDILEGDPVEFLPLQIGEVQVYEVGKSTSVARRLTLTDPEKLPNLEYSTIMVGDRVIKRAGLPSSEELQQG